MGDSKQIVFKAVDDYVTLRLPSSLIGPADEMVAEKFMGYRSRAEVVADALRTFYRSCRGAA